MDVYGDNILETGNNLTEIMDLKVFLDEQFKIKDLSFVNFFLGLEFNETDQ